MDIRFNKTSFPNNRILQYLNMESITDAEYRHAKKVWNAYEIKNLGECHDLHVQRNTLLLAKVFESFHKKWIGM